MKPEFTLPNIITASRILLTPLFIWMMMSSDGLMVQLSAGVFLIAAISDWYDGWFARRYNMMSAFGRFFDPLADKVLIGAAFFAFSFLEILPFWMVCIVVGRDILVTVLRVLADRKQRPVVTSRLAKWKTALQLIFLWYIVAAYTMNNIQWLQNHIAPSTLEGLTSFWVTSLSMGVLTLLSIITAVQYVIENRHVLPFFGNDHLASTTS